MMSMSEAIRTIAFKVRKHKVLPYLVLSSSFTLQHLASTASTFCKGVWLIALWLIATCCQHFQTCQHKAK